MSRGSAQVAIRFPDDVLAMLDQLCETLPPLPASLREYVAQGDRDAVQLSRAAVVRLAVVNLFSLGRVIETPTIEQLASIGQKFAIHDPVELIEMLTYDVGAARRVIMRTMDEWSGR
jgi:hypothetical protein